MKGIDTSEDNDFRADRYSRQILFEDIGVQGQRRIDASHVLVLGCGGLGSIAAEMLARMGVGRISLVDRDIVELNNLHRQSLYTESDVEAGLPKAIAARQKLMKINSSITIDPIVDDLNRFNIESVIADADLIIDATDNYFTRYLLNEACVKLGKVWIFGTCSESYGMMATFIPGLTPCFRCLFNTIHPDQEEFSSEVNGIINPIVHTIASLQGADAIKWLVGRMDLINNGLVTIDLWRNSFEKVDFVGINSDGKCPVCNYHQFDNLNGRYGVAYATVLGINGVHLLPFTPIDVDPYAICEKLDNDQLYAVNDHVIKLNDGRYQLILFNNGRAIVRGTTDMAIARELVKKYLEMQCF